MIETILIILVLVALLIKSVRKPKNFPPGPTPLPPVGNYQTLDKNNPQNTFDSHYEKYGPYVGYLMGGFNVVLVSGWEAVNEAFRNDDILGRPDVCLARDRFDGENYGVFMTDGKDWRTQKRFSLRHFRNLGFGKKRHEAIIQEETKEFLEMIRGTRGKPFSLEKFISTASINFIWIILGNKRFAHSDETINFLSARIRDTLHNIKVFGSIAVVFPFLRYLFPERTGYRSLKRGSKGLKDFAQKAIREHDSTRDRNNPRDFIDIYLEEMQKPDADSSFSERQLEGICMDMLLAGVDTSASVLSFSVLFLCLKKDLQDKLYEEILEHVGTDQLPSTEDKINLVYTQAVLMEVMRMRPPGPTAVPHRATIDTTLGGYHVPEGTIVLTNLNSIFMDKHYWKDPENFRPERFITPDGKLKRDERLIPFGKGKRACIGETLVQSSHFILLASMIQKFSISFDPNLPTPGTEGVTGFTTAAPFFQVVATPRN